MEESDNPFAPGAGTQPPELVGRGAILRDAVTALKRVQGGRAAKSQMLLGLRGVGKTVLLNRIERLAEEERAETIFLEAPENGRLASLLAPALRKVILRLSHFQTARAAVRRATEALRNFVSVFKVTIHDFEMSVTPVQGIADTGDLSLDLTDLLVTVAQAAHAAHKVVVLLIDEVQYLSEEELSALIVAFHKASQKQLPLVFIGAGLPQLAGLAGDAKSYSERLFAYPTVGPLNDVDAREALNGPLGRENVEITAQGLDEILRLTQGYPYFLQEWGYHCWNLAEGSVIDIAVVRRATDNALRALDDNFFRVRSNRLTPRERDYVWAMARLGPGKHRSGDIARAMSTTVNKVAPLRSTLIAKGMIYSPNHGDTAFTVPLFDEFLHRTNAADANASEDNGL